MTNLARDVLDREYLEIRCRLLDLAASLDRLDRAAGSITDDPRMATIMKGLEIVRTCEAGTRAEQIQLLFSQLYEPNWRESYDVDSGLRRLHD